MLISYLQLAGKTLLAVWTLLLCVKAQPPPPTVAPSFLPYVSLGSTDGVQREYVGHFDDGVSHAIHIPGGFPFGNLIHSFVYVGTNGMISFSEPFYSAVATPFPGSAASAYIVAPYWDDVDIRLTGNVSYEVHSRSGNNPGSNQLLDEVSSYVEVLIGQSFQGIWMLVAEWKEVHPWPHGNSVDNPTWSLFYPELALSNTWQGLVITDGVNSYAVFTYQCGDMNWAHGPTIGFNAAGSTFANHPNTGSSSGEGIACLNTPYSQWYNLVYEISLPNATNLSAALPTIEPPQSSYLSFLEFTNSTATSGTLPPCQNCTVPITVPGNGFPFGSHYHSTVYIGTNGIFSFGQDFRHDLPRPFPLANDITIIFSYLVAPYWSNIDTRLAGQVNYEVHVMGESSTSNDYLGRVSSLINSEEDPDFSGSWMIVATWDSVHPFPHGSSAEQDRVDPYLQSMNTFQGILITNGTQSYSVFTYECDQLEWSDEATIGYNAGGDYNASHPLSGTLFANSIDCLHSNINVTVNNIIFDLVPGALVIGTTAPPPSTLGSCIGAGYSDCCQDSNCLGDVGDCYCDEYCFSLNDCCTDAKDICSIEAPHENGTYLIFGSQQFLSRISATGIDHDLHVLVHQSHTNVIGVDYDYGRGFLYWSGHNRALHRSDMDGTNVDLLLNTSIHTVDDIAVDWIGNNLYWTDAAYAHIEVMDMVTRHRRVLLRAGGNTVPSGIAVDPGTRFMYWTDWGGIARIERASMDGLDRRVLHNTNLVQPYGITVDYEAQRIYWVDSDLGRIEFSNSDGSGRFTLIADAYRPFSLSIDGDLLFWTGLQTPTIHATHKIFSIGTSLLYSNARTHVFGIETINPNRQAQHIYNPCDQSSCSFMCLLSATDPAGFSCTCPDGYELSSDGTNCTFVSTPLPPDAPGSCIAAGYQDCCTAGLCVGNPPTCSCDTDCYFLGTCCPDISATCSIGSCAAAGFRTCCNPIIDVCIGSDSICYCDDSCHIYNDCCYDKVDLCPPGTSLTPGSCAAAGHTTCCDDGSECLGAPANCKCDAECRDHEDCCGDVDLTCPITPLPVQTTWLPYLTLQTTPGVVTYTVPPGDDVYSSPIQIPGGFPIGNDKLFSVFIGINGVISFQEGFAHHLPNHFPSELTFISSAFLLAPFWSDIDTMLYGSILYEVHDQSNSMLLSQVNDFISNYTESTFDGTWMLVVQWDEVIHHSVAAMTSESTNTFQAIAITDGSQSYAVYTYRCGHLEWSGGATIGYNGGPVGNFYANHPFSGLNAKNIACLNAGVTEWSNVVYNVSCDVCIATQPPPTIEPPQAIYLEFLEKTDNSLIMPRCDDCVSPPINLPPNIVPFGDSYHDVAHISTNGVISFGHTFPYHGATLLPNLNDPSVFTSYIAAPYWGDINNQNVGEIWYDTHEIGLNTISNLMLEKVSSLVRSEQNLSSFQATWMVVATWNGSVKFGDNLGIERNTFQGIVITNGSKTYAVYTYLCNDLQWSDGSVIGFNAGGSYYANHPLSNSIEARDIDCVHSPESEWNNVVYDVGTIPVPINPTTPPTTQPTTPPTSQPITPPTSQPTTPPTTQPTTPPTTQPTTPPTSQPTTPPPTTPPTTQPTTPPTSQPTTPPISQPTTPPTSQPTIPPTSQPTTPPTSQPTTLQPTTLLPPIVVVSGLSAVAPQDSDTALIVSWNPTAEVDVYRVMVTNYSLALVTDLAIPGDTISITVTDLGPFIPYNVTVIAVFTFGEGPPTSILNFTHQGVPPVPPSNVKVEKMDSGTKIRVSWDPLTPEEAWGFVTSYAVSYKKVGESRKRQTMEKTVPGTESSTIIEGLDPNQDYFVSVRANTKAGMGNLSKPTSIKASTAANVGGTAAGVSGAVVAGSLIALIIALILAALLIMVAIWIAKKKNSAKELQLLENDPTLDGQASTCSYSTLDKVPSYQNPLYESNAAAGAIVLPGPAVADDDPMYEDIRGVNFSQYETPVSKNIFKFD